MPSASLCQVHNSPNEHVKAAEQYLAFLLPEKKPEPVVGDGCGVCIAREKAELDAAIESSLVELKAQRERELDGRIRKIVRDEMGRDVSVKARGR